MQQILIEKKIGLLKENAAFSTKPGTWKSTHQCHHNMHWSYVTNWPLTVALQKLLESSGEKLCRTSINQGPLGRADRYLCCNHEFHPCPDRCSSHQAELKKSRILLHRNWCLLTVFHHAVFHGLHFQVIKIGYYPTSGGEEGVRELVPVSEMAAKAAEQHVFLIWNVSLILKNNNTYHLL